MKECKRCHRQLPETEFYKNISAKDGLQSWCKSCINDYDKNVRPFKEKNKNGGGGNPALAEFTPRQLIDELRKRGYTGKLKYTQTIKL